MMAENEIFFRRTDDGAVRSFEAAAEVSVAADRLQRTIADFPEFMRSMSTIYPKDVVLSKGQWPELGFEYALFARVQFWSFVVHMRLVEFDPLKGFMFDCTAFFGLFKAKVGAELKDLGDGKYKIIWRQIYARDTFFMKVFMLLESQREAMETKEVIEKWLQIMRP